MKYAVLLLAVALTACSAIQRAPQLSPKADAADAQSRFGDLVSRSDVEVTGRDWNCKGCYK